MHEFFCLCNVNVHVFIISKTLTLQWVFFCHQNIKYAELIVMWKAQIGINLHQRIKIWILVKAKKVCIHYLWFFSFRFIYYLNVLHITLITFCKTRFLYFSCSKPVNLICFRNTWRGRNRTITRWWKIW